ncbi:MAG: hypothetical protein DRI91_02620 [Aquificota bacterium]|nr:MAG: hypothetical protein DRI91_02620 [Aquificota bacterium]
MFSLGYPFLQGNWDLTCVSQFRHSGKYRQIQGAREFIGLQRPPVKAVQGSTKGIKPAGKQRLYVDFQLTGG